VAAIAILLWKSRVESLDQEGQVIESAIPTVEPPENAVVSRCRRAEAVWPILAGVAYLVFLGSISLNAPV
jgi:hypothetical protein